MNTPRNTLCLVSTLLGAALASMAPNQARACSEPFPSLQFDGSSPAEGAQDAVLSAPIAVYAAAFDGPFVDETTFEFFVSGADGTDVPGAVSIDTFSGSQVLVLFQPDAPLAAGARYDVRIPFDGSWSWEEGEYTFSFTTGSGELPPNDRITVDDVRTETSELQRFGDCLSEDDFDSCGGCFERELLSTERIFTATAKVYRAGQRQVLLLRSGLGATPAEAEAVRARSTFALLGLSPAVEVRAGTGFESVWGGSEACVAVEVTDLSGARVAASTKCIAAPDFGTVDPVPPTPVDPLEPDVNEPGTPDGPSSPSTSSSKSDGGCQAAPGSTTVFPREALLLLALLAARRPCRKRARAHSR